MLQRTKLVFIFEVVSRPPLVRLRIQGADRQRGWRSAASV